MTRRPAVLALAASLLPYALLLALFPATGDQDAAIHAIYARFPTEPSRVLSAWARPLFAVPYLLPAAIGYQAMRLFTVGICAGTGWLTYLVARRIGIPRPWLVIPLTLWQPVLYQVGAETMTEPIFALFLAAGLLALANERVHLAAAILSFLPLARPEGPIILAVLAMSWLPKALKDRRRWISIALLGLGMIVWELASLVVTGDPRFLLASFPWAYESPYYTGPLDHYVRRWSHIVGIGVLPLWLAGLVRAWRSGILRLSVVFTAAVFVVHAILFTTGRFASIGFDRYFATIAPLTGLIAAAGAGALASWIPRLSRPIIPVLLALEAVHAFVAFDSKPFNHMPAATLESIRQARERFDLSGRTVLSADYFGYVFLDIDRGSDALPVAEHEVTAPAIEKYPPGTVVLWDDITGDWWFHLAVEDFTARGYRLDWERRIMLGSPRAPIYDWLRGSPLRWLYDKIGEAPTRPFRQAVLVRG